MRVNQIIKKTEQIIKSAYKNNMKKKMNRNCQNRSIVYVKK